MPCNILQHTAIHCNTLQHTATPCNTLQCPATYCNILQYTATHCNTHKCLESLVMRAVREWKQHQYRDQYISKLNIHIQRSIKLENAPILQLIKTWKRTYIATNQTWKNTYAATNQNDTAPMLRPIKMTQHLCCDQSNMKKHSYCNQYPCPSCSISCNTLQHTATHCNTLQHTATHCNTLQHTFMPWISRYAGNSRYRCFFQWSPTATNFCRSESLQTQPATKCWIWDDYQMWNMKWWPTV